MSSCISGGGRAYRLDLEIIKSPSTSWTSNSSSPSSTLSESSNSPRAISTRKPRTPRKRPNQTYNEAAAILSTAYPKIFPTTKPPRKFTKSHLVENPSFPFEPSDLLIPFQVIENPGFLLHAPILERPVFPKGSNPFDKPCQSPGEITSQTNSESVLDEEFQEDFDAESILDEETEQGIDTIMGNLSVENDPVDDPNLDHNPVDFCYGFPVGFDYGYGMIRRDLRAIRHVDEGDWWRFPSVNVNVLDLNPKNHVVEKKNKKKKKIVELKNLDSGHKEKSNSGLDHKGNSGCSDQETGPDPTGSVNNEGLLLKLNYDGVLNAWSDKGSPFSGDAPAGSECSGNDVQARLAQIDLFSENGGVREASVLRYKEKRRTRLFSKKIRYQVRKVNADRRPRMKGRFVRTPNSPDNEEG